MRVRRTPEQQREDHREGIAAAAQDMGPRMSREARPVPLHQPISDVRGGTGCAPSSHEGVQNLSSWRATLRWSPRCCSEVLPDAKGKGKQGPILVYCPTLAPRARQAHLPYPLPWCPLGLYPGWGRLQSPVS